MKQLLWYCCPPRIVLLIVGNIDLNYLTVEYIVVVVVVAYSVLGIIFLLWLELFLQNNIQICIHMHILFVN